MAIWQRMAERVADAGDVNVAVVGVGFMGRGLVYQLGVVPGMRAAIVVNRTAENGVRAFELAGFGPESVVVTEDPELATSAIADGRPTVVPFPELLGDIHPVDVVVEA